MSAEKVGPLPSAPQEPEAPPNYADAIQPGSSASSTSPTPPATSQDPPSYSASASSSSPSQTQQPAPAAAPGNAGVAFPAAFSVYRSVRGSGSGGAAGGSRAFHIGVHEAHPLFAVSVLTQHGDNPRIALHSGPDEASPPLAIAEVNESRIGVALSLPGAEREFVTVESIWSGWHRTYRFAVTTPATAAATSSASSVISQGPAYQRREEFEWRHSTGAAVQALAARPMGWKLVRLGQAGQSATVARRSQTGEMETVRVPKIYTTSDGREVVAVWATVRMSYSKMLRFSFVESAVKGCRLDREGGGVTAPGDAEAGLGSRWKVLAVAMMLVMWEEERINRYGPGRGMFDGGQVAPL